VGLTALLVALVPGPLAAQAEPPSAPPGSTPEIGRGATLTARYHVRQLENVLERAVQHAADMMRRRLQSLTPDVLAIAGSPRAQGFRIDGYGLFFSVEIPRLSESVNWALRVLSQDRDQRVLASLQKVFSAEQDPLVRADLERAIRTMQLQLAMVPRPPAASSVDARAAAAPQPRIFVESAGPAAANRVEGEATPPAVTPSGGVQLSTAAAAAPRPEVPVEAMTDPSSAYEDEVKHALVDAMLDYAGSIELPSSEWVTIAARDAGYVAFPDSVSDMVTVTLSVRVADLMEFRAQRLTRDQARTRVVVKEF